MDSDLKAPPDMFIVVVYTIFDPKGQVLYTTHCLKEADAFVKKNARKEENGPPVVGLYILDDQGKSLC